MRVLDHRIVGCRQDHGRAGAVAAAARRRSFRHFPRRRHAARGDRRGPGPQPRQPAQVRDAQCAPLPDARQPGRRCGLPDHLDVSRSAALESREHSGLLRDLSARADGRAAAPGRQGDLRRGKARRALRDVVGLDVAAELPEAPDLVLDNFGALDSSAAVDRIWNECVAAGALPAQDTGRSGRDSRPRRRRSRRSRRACGPRGILPQIRFSVGEWRADRGRVLASIQAERWGSKPVIVRSSSQNEDGAVSSQAGSYDSVLGVLRRGTADSGDRASHRLVRRGGSSRGPDLRAAHARARRDGRRRLLAPAERRTAPTIIVNYDDRSGRTDVVTGGTGDNLQTFLCLKSRADACPAALAPVLALMGELETLFACDAIDVEFAIDGDGKLYLLQVRQLSVERQGMVADGQVERRAGRRRAQGRAAEPAAPLPARQPLDLRRHARLESGGDHRPAALAAVVVAVPRAHHRRHLGLPARQLRLPESAQLPAAGELSRAAVHRRARELQFLRSARCAERSRLAARQLLHRPAARRAAAARQGGVRDHLFVLHPRSAAAHGEALGKRLLLARTSPSSRARCAA